jgi:hypothetical protein
MKMVPSKSEKQMIFRFVPIFDVSTRCIEGRGTLRDFTSTAGGVIAAGAIVKVCFCSVRNKCVWWWCGLKM